MRDGALEAALDQVRGLVPAQKRNIITPERITEPGFTLSWPAYFGAVPWVASKTAGRVADVRARRDAEAADLRRAGVGEIVAVQVRRGA